MGCLVDVVVAVVLFLVIGIAAGETHSSQGSFRIDLTTVPSLIFIGLLMAYYFGVSRPRRKRRQG